MLPAQATIANINWALIERAIVYNNDFLVSFQEFLGFNPFLASVLISYCLKISKNLCCFQGVQKGIIGQKWVNGIFADFSNNF